MRLDTTAFINNKGNNIFSSIQMKKQNPLNKALQELISNASSGMEKERILEDNVQKKLEKASLDTYTKTEMESGDLSTMSTETLKDLAAIMKLAASNTNSYQDELQVYQDNLQKFDSAISKYEEMVARTDLIPKELSVESINEFLGKAKEARNAYKENAGRHLQNQSKYYQEQIKAGVKLGSGISGEDYSDVKDLDLEFHSDVSNIYSEIERVSGHLDNIGGCAADSLNSIYRELEKRGEHTGYQLFLEQNIKSSKQLILKVSDKSEILSFIDSLGSYDKK